jgi:AcrR family transcriptional regulator
MESMTDSAPARRAGSRPYGSASVDRNQILDEAAAVFSERGYRATNLAIVAERLGVTRQALYHHFSQKDAILYALFDRTMSIFEVRVLGIQRASPGATFAAMLEEHALICAANIALVRISTTEDLELPADLFQRVAQRRRDYHRAFVSAYRAGMESGELRWTSELGATVNFLLAACQALVRWYRPTGREKPEAMAKMISNLMCNGVFRQRESAPDSE